MVDRVSRSQASTIEATTRLAKAQPDLAKLQAAIDKIKAGGTDKIRSSTMNAPKSGRKYMTTDGKKYAVSGEYTPKIFEKLEKIGLSMEDSVPGLANLDVMEQETTEGGKTVGELYWQKLKERFGDEPADSRKGEYFRLLQAQGAFEGHLKILPYNEVPLPPPSIEASQTVWADEKMPLRPADGKGLIDQKAVMKRLSELEKNEDISGELENIRTEVINSIRDKDSYAKELASTMESDEYFGTISRMEAAGKGDEAQKRFASDIRALEVLDEEKAHELSQRFGTAAMWNSVDDVLKDGNVSDNTRSLVASDYASYAQKMFLISELGAKRGLDLFKQVKKGKPVSEIKLNSGERETLERGIRVNNALKDYINSDSGWDWFTKGLKSDRIEPLDNENRAFKNMLEQDDLNKSEQKGVMNALRKLNGSGALGAIGGLAGISIGITELTGGRGAETTEERMGAARFFLVAGATLPDSIRLGSKAIQKVANVRGRDQILGLDEPTYAHGKRLSKEAVENWKKLGLAESGVVSKQMATAVDKLPKATREWVKKSTGIMSDRIDGKGNWNGRTTRGQMAGNFLRTLGVAADGAGGVLDIVLGAKALDRAQATATKLARRPPACRSAPARRSWRVVFRGRRRCWGYRGPNRRRLCLA